MQPAAMVYGKAFSVELQLWEGFNRYLSISLATLALGIGAFQVSSPLLLKAAKTFSVLSPLGADAGYQRGLKGILSIAAWLTNRLQTGLLRDYIRVIICRCISGYGLLAERIGIRGVQLAAWQPKVALLAGIMAVAALAAIFRKVSVGLDFVFRYRGLWRGYALLVL